MAPDLTKLFNQFAGKEIPMTETTKKYANGARGIYREVALADPKHPTLQAMEKTAQANGLTLRVLWDGVMGTMDMNPNRINAYIKKEADGKYRISGNFKIG
jgi:hypothetical protein